MLIALKWRLAATVLLAGMRLMTTVTAEPVDPPVASTSFARPATALVDAATAKRDPIWALGQRLFFDPTLSKTGRTSCATCHPPDHAWSGTTSLAVGDSGVALTFKAPTLFGVGRLNRLGWTGRFSGIEAVSRFAITSPTNMGISIADVATRLGGDASYAEAFHQAFGNEAITDATILRALSVFTDSIASNAPFDRWIAGDKSAVGASAKRGFAIFVGKGRCAACHEGPSFTDGAFHDIGSAPSDPGRGAIFKTSLKLQHAYKTPSLRNVVNRAPYMHDGSQKTLADVVDLYDRGGIDRASRADAIAPLYLTIAEKSDLIAFLGSLSGKTRFSPRP